MTSRTITIALDAMGGDHGVAEAVGGAARLSLEPTDIHVVCVGEVEAMREVLDGLPHEPARLELAASGPAIPMCARPGDALAERTDWSVSRAAQLVAAGEADALVSAGNTGATVLSAARCFRRVPGIRRAALASVYPTVRPRGPKEDPFALMLDVGATLRATADDLVGFAVMGAAYSAIVSEVEAPRVALLSNGHEPAKGTPEIVEAHRRLLEAPLDFRGNIEGLDIPKGTVDVVVCDGFLGNVVLKMLEGMGDVIDTLAKDASSRSLQWRVGLSMLGSGLERLRGMTDFNAYGGAPLLGLSAPVIKAHGRSEARALRNALKVAAKTVRGGLIARIEEGAAQLSEGARDAG